jgi:hypothetical protein
MFRRLPAVSVWEGGLTTILTGMADLADKRDICCACRRLKSRFAATICVYVGLKPRSAGWGGTGWPDVQAAAPGSHWD